MNALDEFVERVRNGIAELIALDHDLRGYTIKCEHFRALEERLQPEPILLATIRRGDRGPIYYTQVVLPMHWKPEWHDGYAKVLFYNLKSVVDGADA